MVFGILLAGALGGIIGGSLEKFKRTGGTGECFDLQAIFNEFGRPPNMRYTYKSVPEMVTLREGRYEYTGYPVDNEVIKKFMIMLDSALRKTKGNLTKFMDSCGRWEQRVLSGHVDEEAGKVYFYRHNSIYNPADVPGLRDANLETLKEELGDEIKWYEDKVKNSRTGQLEPNGDLYLLASDYANASDDDENVIVSDDDLGAGNLAPPQSSEDDDDAAMLAAANSDDLMQGLAPPQEESEEDKEARMLAEINSSDFEQGSAPPRR